MNSIYKDQANIQVNRSMTTSDKESFTGVLSQVLITFYLLFVLGLMVVDFFSHMKLKRREEEEQDQYKEQ